jgi:hypothetical protein
MTKLITECFIEMIKKDGKLVKGKNELIKHLEGGKLSRTQAMKAKCYDCMGYFIDGRQDCKIPNCPMFNYRSNKDKVGKQGVNA